MCYEIAQSCCTQRVCQNRTSLLLALQSILPARGRAGKTKTVYSVCGLIGIFYILKNMRVVEISPHIVHHFMKCVTLLSTPLFCRLYLVYQRQRKRCFFMAVTEPIRNKNHIREMANYYLSKGNFRNHLLIVMGVHTGLRISDLLQLKRSDIYNYQQGCFHSHIHLVEQKTGKTRAIALNKKVLSALALCFRTQSGIADDFLFQSRRRSHRPIGRTQAWRVVKEAAAAIGVAGVIGCHSLRKTLGYHAWKAGVAAVLLMDLFNHSSFEVTRRYLGISQDDRDAVYLGLALM